MTKKLGELQAKHEIRIAAFVLMNNHFHLLLLTPREDIDRIMYFFMKEVTMDIQKCTGRINKIFGGRYKASMIESFEHLMNVYKYIHRNPLEVKLVKRAECYFYGTLRLQISPHVLPFKIEKILPPHAFKDFENLDELTWINTRFAPKEAASIKCGLTKTVFAYQKDKSSGRPIGPIVKYPNKISEVRY